VSRSVCHPKRSSGLRSSCEVDDPYELSSAPEACALPPSNTPDPVVMLRGRCFGSPISSARGRYDSLRITASHVRWPSLVSQETLQHSRIRFCKVRELLGSREIPVLKSLFCFVQV
jgi:hypothetical protein